MGGLACVLLCAGVAIAQQAPSPAEVQARLQQWDALPYPQRQQQRMAWQAWREMDATEQAEVRAAAARFAALPASEQQALRAQFSALPGEEIHGFALGPKLGRYYPQLQPLLGWVPEMQRLPLLQVLQTMSRQELELLVRIAFSTPPSRRDAIRRQLIALPASQRLDWLVQQSER